MKKYRFLPLLTLLLLGFVPLASTQEVLNFYSEMANEELANKLVNQMTNDELLGQVLMLGYRGENADETILNWIKDKKIGAIKVFGWNGNNLKALGKAIKTMQTQALNTKLKIPLVIATDQEGGWVRHVKGDTSITPGNLALGASGIPYDSYTTGKIIGEELKVLGINMNLAPDIDVYLNPLADVIGPRAFSSNPIQTGELGTAFFKGMDQVGVISTAKHYPGHGNASEDSHGTLPVIPSTREFINNNDLIPYKMMIKEGLPAILVGHLAFPEITGSMIPASQSPLFLKTILREELGFEGVVVTDDLVMGGAFHGDIKTLSQVCEASLRAGSDFLMVSRTPKEHEKIWNTLRPLMDKDPTFLASVKEANYRILMVKLQYLKRKDHVPFFPGPQEIETKIPAPESQDFLINQSARSITAIKTHLMPLGKNSRVLMVGMYYDFRKQGEQFFTHSQSLTIPYSFNSQEKWQLIDSIIEESKDKDGIVFCLSRYQDLRILKELKPLSNKLIVLSTLTPIYLREVPWVKDAIAVYGTGEESFFAGLANIRGDFKSRGKLPVPITGY